MELIEQNTTKGLEEHKQNLEKDCQKRNQSLFDSNSIAVR